MRYPAVLSLLGLALLLGACNDEGNTTEASGPNPNMPAPQRGLLPTMKIAEPAAWGDQKPTVPEGYSVSAIATDLQIPRQTLVLPNGDILVSEGKGGTEAQLKPKDAIASLVKARGTSALKGGNRLTLLRDADGDGVYELKAVFADHLNAPFGLAYADGHVYVADQDALLRFDYAPGQTKTSGPPTKVTDLPAQVNHHWTKSLSISPDGRWLYVGIGSNSNITERGMEVEIDRARVWQIDAQSGAYKPYATGLRNPAGLKVQPSTGKLWAVVNERDELGPDLVPDYLTSVREGAFYGWPYSYWGQNVDSRVQPQDPAMVAKAIKPDYSLGSHVAPLGIDFSVPAMGDKYADGVFVGEHGSWNRENPVGYKVVFIPFSNGLPAGAPVDFATGFRGSDGKTRGRPVGVTVDPHGALIIADDLSNTVWRVTRDR